jgi:hypothetical protein
MPFLSSQAVPALWGDEVASPQSEPLIPPPCPVAPPQEKIVCCLASLQVEVEGLPPFQGLPSPPHHHISAIPTPTFHYTTVGKGKSKTERPALPRLAPPVLVCS